MTRPGPWRRSAEARQASPGPAALNPVPAQWAHLLLTQGDLAAAEALDARVQPRRRRRAGLSREPGYLVLARVLLAQGLRGQALALLDRLHAAAVIQDRAGSIIQAGALRALALAATGQEAAAAHRPGRGALDAGLPAGLYPGLR